MFNRDKSFEAVGLFQKDDKREELLYEGMCRYYAPIKLITEEINMNQLILGLDTNILKLLQLDRLLVGSLLDAAKSDRVNLIIPSQCALEYWNNFATFNQESLRGPMQNAKKLSEFAESPEVQESAKQILSHLSEMVSNTPASPEAFLDRSIGVIESLAQVSYVSFVDRLRFRPLAEARFMTKMPPGFQDSSKASPYGDFYVWSDFLIGALCVLDTVHWEEATLLFLTNDKKSDWRSGSIAHPFLTTEAASVTGCHLQLGDIDMLKEVLKKAGFR